MSASAILRNLTRWLSVAAFACPAGAETILDQFLARISSEPDLAAGAIFLNYAVAGTSPGTTSMSGAVDGSVYVATIGSGVAYLSVQAGDIALTESAPVLSLQSPLEISASSLGTSNSGAITVRRTNNGTTAIMDDGSIVESYPTSGISTLNGAMTNVPVLGNVVLSGPSGTLPYEAIKTSAIGASNSGAISINVSSAQGGVTNAQP